MPVYNTEKYLKQAIESVLQQENIDLDLCVINDCSTDNSMDIINEYKNNDKVIILENDENQGTYYSRNRGLEVLRNGDYTHFTIHDSDDVSLVDRYSEMMKLFTEDVYCVPTVYMRIHESHISDSNIDMSKGKVNTDGGNGIGIYYREIFNQIGYYDNNRFGADTDYFFRAREWCKQNNKKITKFTDVMYFARERGDNLNKVFTNRREYINKIYSDLENMKQTGNFWRDNFNEKKKVY